MVPGSGEAEREHLLRDGGPQRQHAERHDTIGRSLDTVRPWAQNALLAVDVSGKKLVITPTYYVFRHVSQFTDVGAKVLSASGDALAWKNPDGSSVAVIYNGGGAKKMIVSMAGKKLQFDAPGNGWATVNWK